MSDVNLRDLQLFQLSILKELDRICKNNNIKYYLAYGTCIGAVRHHGFIPWDDDIDVHMMYDDYLRFMDVCKTQLDPRFYFQSHFNDAKTYVSWNRIGVKNSTSINLSLSHVHMPWGICIDIFPIFPYSDDPSTQAKISSYYRKFVLLSLKHYQKGTLKESHGIEKIKKMAHLLIPDRLNCFLFRHYFKKLGQINEKTNDYVTGPYMIEKNHYLKKEVFGDPVYLQFEDCKFPCPNNYHDYLTLIYGNYMEIPKNKVKHSDDPNVIIKLDEPYQKYWR